LVGVYDVDTDQIVPSQPLNHDHDEWRPQRLAIYSVDPSSVVSGGSILGDKTRMPELSRHPRVFVRPAPTGTTTMVSTNNDQESVLGMGQLGGLAGAATDDVITLCGTVGYDLVVVETVGLGQSETEVAHVVDMMILLVPPAGGDDLQGSKKGILEVADLIVVTKADGDLLSTAKHTAADYSGAARFRGLVDSESDSNAVPRAQEVLLVSAVTGSGLGQVWSAIAKFRNQQLDEQNAEREQRRRQKQRVYWMYRHLQTLVGNQVRSDPRLTRHSAFLQDELRACRITPRSAATELFDDLVGRNVADDTSHLK
jgi:LAO/AO transport system kinase